MLNIIRTNSSTPDFIKLIKHLDRELASHDGDMADWFAQYNKLPYLPTVVMAYHDKIPVGCGAFKEFDKNTVEIKRMFVNKEFRARGIASKVLWELEAWAKEHGYERCVLETGPKQIEAIGLYERNQYKRIPNFPPYIGQDLSICYEKILSS